MRPSLAWSRNSAPSLRAISRPARAASAWVGWTEVARSLPSRTTAHPSARERTWIGALSATPLEAGQGVREAAQGPLVLALLLVSMPLGPLGLGLGLPGLPPLAGRPPGPPSPSPVARLDAARPSWPRPRLAWSSLSARPPPPPRPSSAGRGPRPSWPRRPPGRRRLLWPCLWLSPTYRPPFAGRPCSVGRTRRPRQLHPGEGLAPGGGF